MTRRKRFTATENADLGSALSQLRALYASEAGKSNIDWLMGSRRKRLERIAAKSLTNALYPLSVAAVGVGAVAASINADHRNRARSNPQSTGRRAWERLAPAASGVVSGATTAFATVRAGRSVLIRMEATRELRALQKVYQAISTGEAEPDENRQTTIQTSDALKQLIDLLVSAVRNGHDLGITSDRTVGRSL